MNARGYAGGGAAEDMRPPAQAPSATVRVERVEPEMVDHPAHYNSHPSGIECIDVIEHMSLNVGNAVKYLWRADEKGKPIEDLRKAVWYIEREIARRERAESGHS